MLKSESQAMVWDQCVVNFTMRSRNHLSRTYKDAINNNFWYLTRLFDDVSSTFFSVEFRMFFFFRLDSEIPNKSSMKNSISIIFENILSHFRKQSKSPLRLSLTYQ